MGCVMVMAVESFVKIKMVEKFRSFRPPVPYAYSDGPGSLYVGSSDVPELPQNEERKDEET